MTRNAEKMFETFLWKIADLLRSDLGSGEFHWLVVPLIFWKRISDTSSEVVDQIGQARGIGPNKEHPFFVPPNARWESVRGVSQELVGVVWGAMRAIEDANPRLVDTFSLTFGSIRENLSDQLLCDAMAALSAIDMSHKSISAFRFGDIMQSILDSPTPWSARKPGETYTPPDIRRLMARLLNPQPQNTVYDPACGFGDLLIDVARLQESHDGASTELKKNKLFGQERDDRVAALARLNMAANGYDDASIAVGDTLREPAFRQGNNVQQFDRVICNPPIAQKFGGYDRSRIDPYGRDFGDVPPGATADFAWLQHILASIDSVTGRAVAVVSRGVLFRRGGRRWIRQQIVETDMLDAIIGLDANHLFGTSIPISLLIFRSRKPSARQGKVLMIDASSLSDKARGRSTLTDAHIEQIVSWYESYRDVDGFVRVVSHEEVSHNNFDLSFAHYINEINERSAVSALESALEHAFAQDKISLRAEHAVVTSEGFRRRIDLSMLHPEFGLFVFEVKLSPHLGTTQSLVEALDQSSSYLADVAALYDESSELEHMVVATTLVYIPNLTRALWESYGYQLPEHLANRVIFAGELEPTQLRDQIEKVGGRKVRYSPKSRKRRKEHDIFISYRRSDSAWAAGRISDLLIREFGEKQVFQDIQSLRPGRDFVEEISHRIETTNILLVIIGSDWLTASDPVSGRRRVDDEADFVRLEILMALEKKLEVIPVLLDGTEMPAREHLPPEIQPLSRRNAFTLTVENFHRDVQSLIESLRNILAEIDSK